MEQQTDEIRGLVVALTATNREMTEKERSDLHKLYRSKEGFLYTRDVGQRLRGETIQSSSKIGSRIKRFRGSTQGDGMMLIGCVGESDRWRMNANFRAAIDVLELFPKVEVDISPADEDDAMEATMREQVSLACVGQGKFRERALALSPICRVTGVSDPRFLRASHIKPWKDCTDAERLDGENGLMLAPHVDHLFDRGYTCATTARTSLTSPSRNEVTFLSWLVTSRCARTSIAGHSLHFSNSTRVARAAASAVGSSVRLSLSPSQK